MEQQKDTRAAIREKEVLRLQEAQVQVTLLLTVWDSLDRVEQIHGHGQLTTVVMQPEEAAVITAADRMALMTPERPA